MGKKLYKVPFDECGEMMTYAQPGSWPPVAEWKDVHEFEDDLVFVGFERGRSAAHAKFRSLNKKVLHRLDGIRGAEYTMFLTDLHDVITGSVLAAGCVSGTFTFVKRGKNYGIALVKKS